MKIIILDSTPYDPSDVELTQLLSGKKIIWKKFNAAITYWDKIEEGTKFIETDYVTLCADDDFIIPRAIYECIDYLENNPEYSSAHGLYFNHSNAQRAKLNKFSIEPLYNKGRSTFEDTGSERINAYLSDQTHYYPFYALQRTSNFRLIWSETSKYVSDWNLHELFSSCLSFAYGKMKILPIFYASREPNTHVINDYEMFKRTFSEDKVNKAVEGVAKHLSKVDGIPFEEADSVARDAFNVYIDKVEKKWRYKLNLNNNIPPLWTQVKSKLRIRNRLYHWLYKGCHPSIYPQYFNDFKKVKDAVILAGLTQKELNISRLDFANLGNHSSS